MQASRELTQAVQFSVTRQAKEAAMHFCRLAQSGAQFTNVAYPTGMRTVIAAVRGEKAEVTLGVAKQLRAAGFKIVA